MYALRPVAARVQRRFYRRQPVRHHGLFPALCSLSVAISTRLVVEQCTLHVRMYVAVLVTRPLRNKGYTAWCVTMWVWHPLSLPQ